MNGRGLSLRLFSLCFLPLILFPVVSTGLEIVYPTDKTFVVDSNYLIIRGGTEPVVNSVVVTVGGVRSDPFDISAPDYRAVWGDMLILAPEFDPGENHVVVEGMTGGVVVNKAEVDLFFVDGLQKKSAPEEYSSYIMHTPEREALCGRCHNMNPTPAEMAMQDVLANPCMSCHARKLDTAYVHGPAGVNQCDYCHDQNSRPAKYRLREAEVVICMECHDEMGGGFNQRKHVHGPVRVGLCTACHDAHSSNKPSQLRTDVNSLCLSCHEKVLSRVHVVRGVSGKSHPLSEVDDPSNPGQQLTCVSCHDPHSGLSAEYFRGEISSRFALCATCHNR